MEKNLYHAQTVKKEKKRVLMDEFIEQTIGFLRVAHKDLEPGSWQDSQGYDAIKNLEALLESPELEDLEVEIERKVY